MVEEVREGDHIVSPGVKSDPESDTHFTGAGLVGTV